MKKVKNRDRNNFLFSNCNFFPKNRRGQVWVETVIYTLIAFVMIGLILSYARPKIQELQDQAIIQQSTDMMKQIDSTILNIGAEGNQRILEITIKQGDLKIDGINNKIIFEMQSQALYSEPGKNISDGSVVILTQKETGYNFVTLTLDYSQNYDIQFQGTKTTKTISKASNAYKLSILNSGADTNGKTTLDISLS
jgi:type II secretory pathway pseudopilin PulG